MVGGHGHGQLFCKAIQQRHEIDRTSLPSHCSLITFINVDTKINFSSNYSFQISRIGEALLEITKNTQINQKYKQNSLLPRNLSGAFENNRPTQLNEL
jgi:hypothetical protein